MGTLFTVIILAVFVNNFVVVQFLGICPFLGLSKKTSSAVGMGVAVTVVMAITCLITYPIYMELLVPRGLEYLQTIVFILVIAALVQFVEIALKKYIPSLYSALGIYLPLITTNCAVLGVTMLVIEKSGPDYGFAHAMVNALGTGIGYLVAMVLFAGVRERLEDADIPEFLKGLPITLVAASLLAVSFNGFAGLVEGLLG